MAVVGTVRADSSPVTTPCWHGVAPDGRIVLSMGDDSHRLRHLQANSRVALADIDELSQRYEGVPYPDRDYRWVTAWVEVEHWHVWGGPAGEA